MTGQVEVVLYHRCDDEDRIVAAYHESSSRLAGTPGLLSDHLMRSSADPGVFTVVSRWRDQAAFLAWEEGAAHKEQTAPLRPFRDLARPKPFEVNVVLSAHEAVVGTGAP